MSEAPVPPPRPRDHLAAVLPTAINWGAIATAVMDEIRDPLDQINRILGDIRGEVREIRGEVREIRGEIREVKAEQQQTRAALAVLIQGQSLFFSKIQISRLLKKKKIHDP
jgi:uncharacterized coiled-coil DUF342 family protein